MQNKALITRLSRFHPYPAMVADELAISLANKYVRNASRVLDPFCGAGRLVMAAAAAGASCTALDRNPLACLITKAKAARTCPKLIQKLREDIRRRKGVPGGSPLVLRESRKVDWFSEMALKELAQIVHWINGKELPGAEKLVIAAALSATTRKTSYCRKDGWKLHRLSKTARKAFDVSPWEVFAQKLEEYELGTAAHPLRNKSIRVFMSDARFMKATDGFVRTPFDVVMTSPPYGDSRTTIQYGAASALCLDVVSHIDGLRTMFEGGRAIDDACLGGCRPKLSTKTTQAVEDIKRYWAGRGTSEGCERISRFLVDVKSVCEGISQVVAENGTVIMIVGRRSVGGFRLKLDEFLIDRFEDLRFRVVERKMRAIGSKRFPRRINRFGGAKTIAAKSAGSTVTMLDEYVITLKHA